MGNSALPKSILLIIIVHYEWLQRGIMNKLSGDKCTFRKPIVSFLFSHGFYTLFTPYYLDIMTITSMESDSDSEREDELIDEDNQLSLSALYRNEVGAATEDMRLAKTTRSQYARNISHIVEWMGKNYPSAVCDGELLLPLDGTALKEFFYHAMLKQDKDGNYLRPPQFYCFNHVNNYRSALKNFYKEKRIEMDFDTNLILKSAMSSFKRRIAQLKADGEMPLFEGKQPMSEVGMRFLAEQALKQRDDFWLYSSCHCFILLCWNLIARAVTVSNILFNAISWEGDAMTIWIGKMKNDQVGKNGYARHVYANPKDPLICPVLSFAIIVFTRGYSRDDSERYAFGKGAKDKFTKWLHNALRACVDAIVAMGLAFDELGSHSFRKGIATLLANCPGGPEAINIWLRAGWSLGPVQSRYIFQGAGGDQFVGRVAAGHNIHDPDFAILPPHFDTSEGPVLTVDEWRDILPGYDTFYPKSFQVALPYLLASLVYHQDWLVATLPADHPLFNQRVWTSGIVERLKDKVLTGVFRNPVSKMTATGVPPHVALSNKVSGLQESVSNKVDNLPREVTREVLDHCQVNGAVPISAQQIETMMSDLRQQVISEIKQTTARGNDISSETYNGSLGAGDCIPNEFRTWVWGGKIQMVPHDFRFPHCNVRTMWDLYWGGRKCDKIRPYRYLRSFNFLNRSDRARWSKASSVMKDFVTCIIESSETGPSSFNELASMAPRNRDDMFDFAVKELCSAGRISVSSMGRVGQLSYITLYNNMRR